ncbi:serine/threonine-protein kinase [Pseudomonas sp. BIGb0427]|uniref:leucine-rich repeat-containing protein kinase family protein n=1 Tax=unclassified Pseudomonas TaxID=196821 RepID=UPI0018A6E848|nr:MULTISPECIES: leucine-rich repeat-containing protein kinase family protein [unclassified Pseudomonas]QPG62434.1 serine/threonine-protein kinase [Pseudomonas sp. BIGb0427]UVM64778.1 leucine-rich repeat-containing serine/threonine-protein kinase [Pseudomonas sp. B21-009]
MHTLEDLKAGRLTGITRLDLACGLEHFPREIFDLADSLQVLNLTGNNLSDLPEDLGRLHQLKVLFCSQNRFRHLPEGIGQCPMLEMVGFKSNQIEQVSGAALPPRLRALVLTDNRIEYLPEALGDCPHLQKLMLAGNRLRELPASLARCTRLELLRLSANRLPALPDWLLQMPRLAWLAYAGNPMAAGYCTPQDPGHCQVIDWQQIDLEQVLGQGASGVIHQARWQQQSAPVAVKLYKGEITSDGLPLNEMSACIAAGDHPQLVRLVGRIDNHPQQLPALVMQLIEPSWFNLAGPPSLDSCTRDCYPRERRLRLASVRRLAAAIAAVGAHLHGHGITHGDLYAHNVLCDEHGDCLLGDFGAASFHPLDGSVATEALQRIEVLAFGVLLGELLACCEGDCEVLRGVQRECVRDEVMLRPGFAEVCQRLRGV